MAAGNNVIVYILTDDENSDRVKIVQSLFTSNLFVVYVSPITIPGGLTIAGLNQEQAVEAYRYEWVLNNARQRHPDNHVIVIKDTSYSAADAETIADIVAALKESDNFDVVFLCDWMDECDKLEGFQPIAGKTISLAQSKAPNGTQALLFSPQGRDMLIGQHKMRNGKMFSPVTLPLSDQLHNSSMAGGITTGMLMPNLIEFDITTDPTATYKVTKCLDKSKSGAMGMNKGIGLLSTDGSGTSSSTWIAVFLIILFIFVLIWALARK